MSLRPTGIEALDVPSLNPMAVPETVTIGGGSGGALTGELTNLKINGISGGLVADRSKVR